MDYRAEELINQTPFICTIVYFWLDILTAAVFGIFLTEFKREERIENGPMEVSAPYLPANDGDDIRSWAGEFDPFADPEERRVLFAVFDSFRCVSIVTFF